MADNDEEEFLGTGGDKINKSLSVDLHSLSLPKDKSLEVSFVLINIPEMGLGQELLNDFYS